mgnify:CR=1 FL=1
MMIAETLLLLLMFTSASDFVSLGLFGQPGQSQFYMDDVQEKNKEKKTVFFVPNKNEEVKISRKLTTLNTDLFLGDEHELKRAK